MRKADLRLNEVRAFPKEGETTAPANSLLGDVADGDAAEQRRAKRLGLLLMVSSSLAMVLLIGLVWLALWHLL